MKLSEKQIKWAIYEYLERRNPELVSDVRDIKIEPFYRKSQPDYTDSDEVFDGVYITEFIKNKTEL